MEQNDCLKLFYKTEKLLRKIMIAKQWHSTMRHYVNQQDVSGSECFKHDQHLDSIHIANKK